MKNRLIFFIPGIIWTIIIFVLLIMPGSDIPSNDFFELIYFDKWVHIGLFGILTVLWGYPFLKSKFESISTFIIIIAFTAITYGIAMEFVQKYYATSRSFDLTDILADAFGTAMGAFFLIRLSKQKGIQL